jgi:DNA-binding NtrC family response regulator
VYSQDSYDSEPLPLRGTRILVVEDSWQIGEAMAGLLKELGAEVSGPVATSTDALRLASEQPPDAALIDFDLRHGERAEGLIELLHVLGIHVVVATGYTELPTVSRQGVTILRKPMSLAALLESLRPAIALKALR